MADRRYDERPLSPEISAAVELLRELPEPRPEWRAEVLQRVAAPDLRDGSDHRRLEPTRRWSVTPFGGLAAALLCALVGAGATAIAMSRHNAPLISSMNAPLPSGGALPVRFTLVAPGAARVSIVGDFNRWDPTVLPLRRSADGRSWEVEVTLRPGRYSYSFVVDGRLARDPSAPQDGADDFGSPNSILMVSGS